MFHTSATYSAVSLLSFNKHIKGSMLLRQAVNITYTLLFLFSILVTQIK